MRSFCCCYLLKASSYDSRFNRLASGDAGGASIGPGNRLKSDGKWAYAYDAAGDVVQKDQLDASGAPTNKKWTYAYDGRHRLVAASWYTGNKEFTVQTFYDAADRRISREKVLFDAVGGEVERVDKDQFSYDGGDGDDVQFVFAKVTGGELGLLSRSLYGPGPDRVVSEDVGTGTRWLLADRQGSVRKVVDNDGVTEQTLDYDAFGVQTQSTADTRPVRQRYTGQNVDADLGQNGHVVDMDTVSWLNGIGEALHDRTCGGSLVGSQALAALSVVLTNLIDAYVTWRTDVKPGTRAIFRRQGRILPACSATR